jgi:hypothetical protein
MPRFVINGGVMYRLTYIKTTSLPQDDITLPRMYGIIHRRRNQGKFNCLIFG